MATPIIKIKRGDTVPGTYNATSGSGLTAGEFGFNRNTGVLYIGTTGGYCGIDEVGAEIANNDLNVIPIGMHISNDTTFGNGSALNLQVGYSDYTVPTTHAVKDYVSNAVTSAAVGVVFRAGDGIGVTSNLDITPASYTVTNTGVIKGFTGIRLTGNIVDGNKIIYASNSVDGLTFTAGDSIMISSDVATKQIIFNNAGVTGINGYTGNIKNINPVVSLDGYTAAVGTAMQTLLTYQTPIVGTNLANGKIDISHASSGVGSGTYNGTINGVPQLHTITVNSTGHITGMSSTDLNFGSALPAGFTEAVQDAAYPGITSGQNKNYGIEAIYSDAADLLRLFNRGITSLSAGVGSVGMSGPVYLSAGTDISVANNYGNNSIQISYSGKNFDTINALKATSVYPNSGIYAGGVTGPGSQFILAESVQDSINFYVGRGIGISAGELSPNVDGILLWNAGVNLLSAYDELKAGNNIVFTRGSGSTENTLTIASTAGGGGGAVAWLQADYTNETSPAEDFDGVYAGDGVTGAINISGINGIVTKQTTGQNGSSSTKDGTLYIGLHSNVVLPVGVYPDGYEGFGPAASIEIPTQRNYQAPTLPPINAGAYPTNPGNYASLIVDKISGGFTGQLFYGDGDGGDPYDPVFSIPQRNNSVPGKTLILTADQGLFWDGVGGAPIDTGRHAEVRLLGYPNPENLSAELQRAFVGTPGAEGVDGCGGGGSCVGFPPVLPSCGVYDLITEQWTAQDFFTSNYASRPTVAVQGNLIARDALYVEKDIWIKGDIIDATTGCLYDFAGAGGGGGGTNPGGNLGLTGDLVVNGSIYVHGGTAFFNVRDLSTESALLRIGGLSASDGYSNPINAISPAVSGYTGDRGLVLFHHSKSPTSVFNLTDEQTAASKTAFVGIDSSEGKFVYYENVGSIATSSNGNNVYTYITDGQVGPAKFREINDVGITADSGQIILRSSPTGSYSSTTNYRLSGHVNIAGPSTLANRGFLTFENNARVNFLSTISPHVVEFVRGITFDYSANANEFDRSADNLRIKYASTTNSSTRTLSFRNPGGSRATIGVDIGRAATSPTTNQPNWETTAGQYAELGQQTLYNKTLSEGTIIDCGTY
jgi:hypothetical protein